MSRTQLALLVVLGLFCAQPAWGFIHFVCTDTTLCVPDPTLYPDPGSYAEYESVTDALAAATAPDSIFVTQGHYVESVALVDGVLVRGGYNLDLSNYLPGTFVATLDGASAATVVTVGPGTGPGTILQGFTITGAGGAPGAAVIVEGGEVILRDNRITDNRYIGLTGGVYVHSGATARLENNRIASNASLGSGGGVRVEFATLVMVGNTILRNSAIHFGGGLYAVASAVACTSNVFEANSAGDGGGAVHLEEAATPATFYGDQFLVNVGGFGGAIWAKNESLVEIEEADFTGNHATASGGAIALNTLSELTCTNCRFADCSAEGRGGAIFGIECTATVLGTDPTFGSSAGWLSRCTAGTTGGGIHMRDSLGEISGVRFTGCRSDSMGGGFYLSRSQFMVTANLVDECQAPEGGGMVFQSETTGNTESFVLNNTISRCSGTAPWGTAPAGGGITIAGSGNAQMATIAGTIVSHTVEGAAIRCRKGGSSQAGNISMRCSSLHNASGNAEVEVSGSRCESAFGVDGTNRAGDDPLHCGATDYRLQETSPDVDANCADGLSGRNNRGYTDETCTGPPPQALEASTWGKIKARYR